MLIVILKTALSKSRLGTTCISLNDVKTSEEVDVRLDVQTVSELLEDQIERAMVEPSGIEPLTS